MRSFLCLAAATLASILDFVATANAQPECTPPPAGLVAWWPGDGDANDLQDGHDGQLLGGASFAPGKVGRAFNLDGVDDSILIPHSEDLNPSGVFSVDAWIKFTPPQSGHILVVDKSHGHTDGTGWVLQAEPNGTMGFGVGIGGGPSGFVGVGTTVSVMDGEWHHIAGVFTGSELQIYRDGALDGTFAHGTAPVNNTREVQIGRSWGGGSPGRYFRGLIDEVEYFDVALSAADVEAMFDAGTAGKCKPPPCEVGTCRDTDQACKACGQPLGTGANPTASDALGILRTAIGARQCRLCVCDVDDSGSVVASDALLTLKRAVGQAVALQCPAGQTTTTTTTTLTTSTTTPSSTAPPSSTTTPSTTSTTIVVVSLVECAPRCSAGWARAAQQYGPSDDRLLP